MLYINMSYIYHIFMYRCVQLSPYNNYIMQPIVQGNLESSIQIQK